MMHQLHRVAQPSCLAVANDLEQISWQGLETDKARVKIEYKDQVSSCKYHRSIKCNHVSIKDGAKSVRERNPGGI